MKNKFFVVVGAPKAGTTSLHQYLKQHSDVFVPERKEMHFFSQPEVLNTYYETDGMVETMEEYVPHFSSATETQICGDISPSYLYNYASAKRIFEFKPDAKIIIILRDPIERAISHYLMDVREGHVDAELIEILKNKDKYPLCHKEYIEVSMYEDQVNEYLNIFPKDQILILQYEEFFNQLDENIHLIFDFLGLKPMKLDLSKKANAYKKSRFNFLKYYRKYKFLKFFSYLFPKSIKQLILHKFIYKSADKPSFEVERSLMKEIFYK